MIFFYPLLKDLEILIRHIPKFSIPTRSRAWDVRKGNVVAPGRKIVAPFPSVDGFKRKKSKKKLSLTAYAVVVETFCN
jgi:hypothetical protein